MGGDMTCRDWRPDGAVLMVKCALWLTCAWLLCTSAAWAQETEHPELLMWDDDAGDGSIDELLMLPFEPGGQRLGGFVEVVPADLPGGSVWLRTSTGMRADEAPRAKPAGCCAARLRGAR